MKIAGQLTAVNRVFYKPSVNDKNAWETPDVTGTHYSVILLTSHYILSPCFRNGPNGPSQKLHGPGRKTGSYSILTSSGQTSYTWQCDRIVCSQPISKSGITYKDQPWHRDCFTCSHCDKVLSGEKFTTHDDKPYCGDCYAQQYAKKCTECTQPVETYHCTECTRPSTGLDIRTSELLETRHI